MDGWQILHWAAAGTSILGAALVSFKKPKRGLEAYSAANILWIIWAVRASDWPLLSMFVVFLVLSVWGRWNWRSA